MIQRSAMPPSVTTRLPAPTHRPTPSLPPVASRASACMPIAQPPALAGPWLSPTIRFHHPASPCPSDRPCCNISSSSHHRHPIDRDLYQRPLARTPPHTSRATKRVIPAADGLATASSRQSQKSGDPYTFLSGYQHHQPPSHAHTLVHQHPTRTHTHARTVARAHPPSPLTVLLPSSSLPPSCLQALRSRLLRRSPYPPSPTPHAPRERCRRPSIPSGCQASPEAAPPQ